MTGGDNSEKESKEFLRVVSRHIPAIFVRSQFGDKRSFLREAVTRYSQKEEADQLAELSKNLDPFLYVYWRTVKNSETKRKELDGDVNVWLLRANGECLFVQNEKIDIEILSENVGNGQRKNVLAGIKYQIGNFYHLLKIDRDDLIAVIKEGR